MEQPVSKISQEDIYKIIMRDYRNYKKDEIIKILNEYNSENENGKFRVWSAVLKISNGDIKELKNQINVAKKDYRDVIAYAEYPMYTEKVGFRNSDFSPKELDRIIMSDWSQYQEWLNKFK